MLDLLLQLLALAITSAISTVKMTQNQISGSATPDASVSGNRMISDMNAARFSQKPEPQPHSALVPVGITFIRRPEWNAS